MTRRGDATHRYRQLAQELSGDLSPARRQQVERELSQLWWGLNEQERAGVPAVEPPPDLSRSELPLMALLTPTDRAAALAAARESEESGDDDPPESPA